MLDALRGCDGWLPQYSWVAEVDDVVVAHAVCTRGHVGDIACLGLGPIAVLPHLQQGGVGSALVHALIGAADAAGEPLIALLGDPAYYGRFGFRPSSEFDIAAPDEDWGPYFQALPLTSWGPQIAGQFRYAEPFNQLP